MLELQELNSEKLNEQKAAQTNGQATLTAENINQVPTAITPERPEDEHLKIGKAKTVAGGVPAVASALKHTVSEMGVVRGMKLLLQVNQTEGFDCPGCAWPDPDDHRSVVEFCENGAKAVACLLYTSPSPRDS